MRRLWLCVVLAGCELESLPGPLEGQLSLELRDSAALRIDTRADGSTHVILTPSADYGLLPAGTSLEADGRVESLPEANATLYSAKLAAPAESDGPCGSEPISLALTLHRQGTNATVIGGLSAYCGADTWFGKPVRVLRLAGALPLP